MRNFLSRSRGTAVNVAVVASGLSLGAGALSLYRARDHTAAPTPDVRIAEAELDLGERGEGEVVKYDFRLLNKSSSDLKISGLSGSCDVSLDPLPLPRVLAAGGALTVGGQFTISPASPCQQSCLAEVSIPVTVRAETAAGAWADRTWQFRSRVAANVTTPPGGVALGAIHERSLVGLRRTAKLPLGDRVARVECHGHLDWGVTLSEPVRDERGKRHVEVTLEWRGKPRPGERIDRLKLEPVDHGGRKLPAAELVIRGDVIEDVASFPRGVLPLGRCRVGSAVEDSVQVVAADPALLHVVEASVGGADGTVEVVREPNDQATAVIRVRVRREGVQEIPVEILATDRSGTTRRVPLVIRYVGYRDGV